MKQQMTTKPKSKRPKREPKPVPEHHQSDHFRHFAGVLERTIGRLGVIPKSELYEVQKAQVEGLINLEATFRRTLQEDPRGYDAYADWVCYIRDERKNILAARPFFRERSEAFTEQISPALKKRDIRALYPHIFNYQFVNMIMKRNVWPVDHPLQKLFKEINKARNLLVEYNMPLVINRVRIFARSTQKSHLEYMDLVQIGTEGLMSAMDKFCLPYTTVFRGVAIGRMVGNFIENYSETMMHFFPHDKQKIYRANKAVGRTAAEGIDHARIAAAVNVTAAGISQQSTNPNEISRLMAAASCVSANSTSVSNIDGEEINQYDRFAAPRELEPDIQAEHSEEVLLVREAIEQLPLLDKKLLFLSGYHF